MSGKRGSRAGKIRGIYPRGNTFWFQKMVNGQRIQVSLGTSDYGEAVAKALQILANPVLVNAEPLHSEIEAFIRHKVRQNEYSRDSAASKKYALKEFASFVKKSNPALIEPADVDRFYQHVRARVTESTAQGYITTLRSFFNWLYQTNKVRTNVVKAVKLARLDSKSRKNFCDRQLVKRLIEGCGRADLKFVLFCGFHAGLRKQEIIEARPDWFDLAAKKIHIKKTSSFRPKDRDERTLPMTNAFKDFLEGYGLRSPFMLHPEVAHGKHRYRWDFRRPWDEYMKKQGVEWVTPHVMRHTFASLHASNGTPIFKVARWLGDDLRVVDKHYAKLSPEDEDVEAVFLVR